MSGNHPYNGAGSDAPIIQKSDAQKAQDIIAYRASHKKFIADMKEYGGATASITCQFYPDGTFNGPNFHGEVSPLMVAGLLTELAKFVQGGTMQLMAAMEQMVAARNAEMLKIRGKTPGH